MSYDERRVAADYKAKRSAAQTEDLPMFRASDPDTSRQAAEKVAPHVTGLQARVIEAFKAHGPMTAKEAEMLPEFGDLGFSTCRKRVSELLKAGVLVAMDIREGATVYALADQAKREGDQAA